METRLFHTLDGSTSSLGLKQVDGHVQCVVPGVGEGLILTSDLIGITAIEPRLAGGFADISGFGESFQKMPFLTCPGCGFGHAFHPKKMAPCGVFPQGADDRIVFSRFYKPCKAVFSDTLSFVCMLI